MTTRSVCLEQLESSQRRVSDSHPSSCDTCLWTSTCKTRLDWESTGATPRQGPFLPQTSHPARPSTPCPTVCYSEKSERQLVRPSSQYLVFHTSSALNDYPICSSSRWLPCRVSAFRPFELSASATSLAVRVRPPRPPSTQLFAPRALVCDAEHLANLDTHLHTSQKLADQTRLASSIHSSDCAHSQA